MRDSGVVAMRTVFLRSCHPNLYDFDLYIANHRVLQLDYFQDPDTMQYSLRADACSVYL